MKERQLVAVLAVLSRAFTLLLFFLGDSLFQDYDTSANLTPPCIRLRRHHPVEASGDGSGSPGPAWDIMLAGERWLDGDVSNDIIKDVDGISLEPRPPPGQGLLVGLLRGQVVWDGVFFVRIARCGYEMEQWHAFMPGVPAVLRLLGGSSFGPKLGSREWRPAETEAALALAGLLLSNVAFVLAAVLLHSLSLAALGHTSPLALPATLLFCFSPASAFFSSIYAESLFALLSFGGMYLWIQLHLRTTASEQPKIQQSFQVSSSTQHGQGTGSDSLIRITSLVSWKLPASVVLFSLSSFFRSNGVLHAGFFLYSSLMLVTSAFKSPNTQKSVHAQEVPNVQMSLNSAASSRIHSPPACGSSEGGSPASASEVLQDRSTTPGSRPCSHLAALFRLCLQVPVLLLCTSVCFLPFFSIQLQGYRHFCASPTFAPATPCPSLAKPKDPRSSTFAGHGGSGGCSYEASSPHGLECSKQSQCLSEKQHRHVELCSASQRCSASQQTPTATNREQWATGEQEQPEEEIQGNSSPMCLSYDMGARVVPLLTSWLQPLAPSILADIRGNADGFDLQNQRPVPMVQAVVAQGESRGQFRSILESEAGAEVGMGTEKRRSRTRPWCQDPLPYLYGFVQREYWNVGFLRYFQWKQVPNFVLAAPSLVLAFLACLTFGFSAKDLVLDVLPFSRSSQCGRNKVPLHGLVSELTLPFFVEMLAMSLFALLVMHAQVSTRFLASCPALYWFGAYVLHQATTHSAPKVYHCLSVWLITSWLLYWLAGSLMFINFYPFT